MQIAGWKKITLGILATIVLGALGSGLWELALKPGGYWIWHGLLTAATFGSKALKDQVYMEAAKGNHEAAAQLSFRVLGWFLFAACGALASYLLDALRLVNAKDTEASDSDKAISSSPKRRKSLRSAILGILVLTCFILVSFSIQQMEVGAANQAYTYFRQSITICRPYITEHQAEMLNSRFAAVRTRKEYIEITDDLKQIAVANHVKLPEFTPW